MSLAMNQVYQMDALAFLERVPDESIDLVFSDLPYGQTQNLWDSIIPTAPLFDHLKRIIKPNGAVLLTATQPFASLLVIAGGAGFYRYEWVLGKTVKTNFLNAKKMPLREHETLQVFYHHLPTYNPQKIPGRHFNKSDTTRKRRNYGEFGKNPHWSDSYYPGTVQYFPPDPELCWTFKDFPDKPINHPTQKPLEMGRYFIRTYSNPGDVVLDMTCGSGTFGLAADLEGRNYLLNDNGFDDAESGKAWAVIAAERIRRDGERIRNDEQAADPFQDNPPDENGYYQKTIF